MSKRLLIAAALLASACFAVDARARPPLPGYDYYSAGDLTAPRPGPTEGAMLLLGGGDWPKPAFHWFVERMGHGRIVLLSASYGRELQEEFMADIGGVTAVETLVFHDRSAASSPRVLDIIRRADGIFIGGGDQSNYVRFFKGTPLNTLLDEHVRAGKPIGGTSAGLAILGAYSYGAMDGGSLVSKDAMKNPLGKGVTIVRDFLHMPHLSKVITDTHFAARERWGRLAVFVGRLAAEEQDDGIVGIGVDERAALCVEANGQARVHAIGRGFAWLFRPGRAPDSLRAGKFNFRGIPVTGVGEEGAIDLANFVVTRPAFDIKVSIVDGEWDAQSLAALRAAAQTPAPARVAAGKSWSLAIHGGASVIERGDLKPGQEVAYRTALNAALGAGEKVLRAGGSSVDAVEAAIRVLEDDPLFNAGRGAVFTADGRNELDASIMSGDTRKAGAVAGVTRTRNPISLARAVMEKSRHVMLASEGADQFSVEQGLEQVDPSYFRTELRWQQLLNWRRDNARLLGPTHSRGTVGAIAIDANGHLAAGTSTGGMTGKRWGRVGDSPVIGAGTYAADGVCAVSATGSGEFFIRTSAARQVCDRIEWQKVSAQQAADATISDIGGIGGDGGVIVMDGSGRIAFAMNSSGMYRGWVTSSVPAGTAIYSTERGPAQ